MIKRFYYHQIKGVIYEQINKGVSAFSIYPYGEQGQLADRILRKEYGLAVNKIVDNNPEKGGISFEEYINSEHMSNEVLLFCCENKNIRQYLKQQMETVNINMVDVFPDCYQYCHSFEEGQLSFEKEREYDRLYGALLDFFLSGSRRIFEEYNICDNNYVEFEMYLANRSDLANELKHALSLALYLITKEITVTENDVLAGKAGYRCINRNYPSKWYEELAVEYERGIIDSELREQMENAGDMWLFSRYPGGHVVPAYDKLLNMGYEEMISELVMKSASADTQQEHFYKSCYIVLRAAQERIRKYAKSAKRIYEETGATKHNLLRIAMTCEHISTSAPKTFFEAVQLLWFAHENIVIEGNLKGISLGRVDQYLFPFYSSDKEKGVITEKEASDIIYELWRKMDFEHAFTFQNVTLGGLIDEHTDASNDLTIFCMEAQLRSRSNQPMLSLRLNDYTKSRYWNKAFELLSTGMGVPALFWDKTVIKAKEYAGLSREDALDYSIIGCVEPTAGGREYSHTEGMRINWAKILELMLNRGICPITGAHWKLNKERELDSIETFDEFYTWYKDELAQAVNTICEYIIKADSVYGNLYSVPYLSTLMRGCVDKGLDATKGGSIYNNLCINFAGMSNTVNSLIAIKEFVFNKRQIKLSELSHLLNENYEECRIFKETDNLPRYGNDDDVVDSIMKELVEKVISILEQYRTARGGRIQPGFYTVWLHGQMGSYMNALPEGRKKGESLASSLSPTQGTDTSGPIAVIKSILKLPLDKMSNGMVLDLKFTKSFFIGDQKSKIIDFVKAYFESGGMEIQFNVVDKETLLRAQKNPEEYKTLLVRVSGFSAYFVELPAVIQNEVIQRYAHDCM